MKRLTVWIFLALLTLGLFIGYCVGYSNGYKSASDGNSQYKKNVEQEIVEKTLKDNPPPECSMSDCPEYEFADVDGDGNLESIVTERTAMTQQAGRIWIIKKGRVVFKSDARAQIGVEPRNGPGEQSNGFIILYNTTYQLSPTFLDSFKSDYYIFKDGKYILEKTESR